MPTPSFRHSLVCALLFAALLLRGLIPAGTMPGGPGELLVLCTPSGMQTLLYDEVTGVLAPADTQEPEPCEFAPLLAHGALLQANGGIEGPRVTVPLFITGPTMKVPGARAPPRARGPPTFI